MPTITIKEILDDGLIGVYDIFLTDTKNKYITLWQGDKPLEPEDQEGDFSMLFTLDHNELIRLRDSCNGAIQQYEQRLINDNICPGYESTFGSVGIEETEQEPEPDGQGHPEDYGDR